MRKRAAKKSLVSESAKAYGDRVVEEWNREYEEKVKRPDAEAKAAGRLVGRVISHPYADGYAHYKIVKENKTTVRIEVIEVDDAWVLPAWGYATTIKKSYALEEFRRIEALAELFGRK